MRGRITDVWEGGIHVPGFANWPGHIKPKTISESVHTVDWLPTLAGVAGVQDGAPPQTDGVDPSPVLFGTGALPPRDLYWIWNRQTSRWALRHGDWKIVRYSTKEPDQDTDWQLFNLKDDPKEKTASPPRIPKSSASSTKGFSSSEPWT